ncbi:MULTISPECIES: pyridoxamine 5'-phosphate oxidase family protein [Nocardioides]|uniref:Pyridoxamine 5'-phosphate oxidase family protein n=1 Tax=Nocardioides vastitatis TaxID=2568655 RepID=A0ABW0ZP06_9ACTN|nr:pyridoxamine 5'-phosphate oxidase family protein [Nocardioides sp.]
MDAADEKRGRLVELTQDECWEQIRSRPVGRVAWIGTEGVSVLPVNFLVDGREVVMRTTPYSALARECPDREVVFEVDDLDEEHRAGWSVLLRGRCRREERTSSGVTPWASGRRILGLRIEVRSVTGRRVLPT